MEIKQLYEKVDVINKHTKDLNNENVKIKEN